ncbi:MAG: nitronate monooxygenase [Microbacterium sp.]
MPILDSRLPIAAAPMAGGPSTLALVRAVTGAGGFGFLAGGYTTPDELGDQIRQFRDSADSFGVNLFAASDPEPAPHAFAAFVDEIHDDAARYDIALDPEPVADDDRLAEKVDLLVAEPVPVVSFTFGLPSSTSIRALQAVGTTVLATVTTTGEARQAAGVGVNGLVVQASGAGGHSATFEPTTDPDPIDAVELVRRVRDDVPLPVIAAGGIDGPDAVTRLLRAGAEAVSVGTLLLRTIEAGTSAPHRAALADPAFDDTVLTRVFTGRPARALRNGFIERHQHAQVTAYPAVHHLTKGLRRAAAQAGDLDILHLWAGTGWRHAPAGSAADAIRWLAGEA